MIHELVRITGHCNNNCIYCYLNKEDFGNVLQSPEDVRNDIISKKENGLDRLIFTGGEPTLNRRLPEYMEFARDQGFSELVMQTNARVCQYDRLAKKYAEAGLNEVLVNFPTADRGLFERLTGTEGSYDQTIKGMENLQTHSVHLVINIVVTSLNHEGLKDTVGFLIGRFSQSVSFLFSSLSIHGNAWKNTWIVPRISQLTPNLVEAMSLCVEKGCHFILPDLCGLPLCQLAGYEQFSALLDEQSCSVRQSDSELSREMIKPESCRDCRWDNCCLGVRRRYAKLYGTDELKPVTHS